jgi:hypothetical protein
MSDGLARARVTCEHPGCDATVELRLIPGRPEDAEALVRLVRDVARQMGWRCGLPGKATRSPEADLTVPGYGKPDVHRVLEGTDLCPRHVE